MKFTEKVRREFSFITGNYRVLIISWIIMDFATEMPSPNFQYYVQALGGTGMALGIIGLANFLGLAIVAFPGGYLADKYGRRQLITTMTFAMAVSFLFFAFATSWHFILIGTIINSLCLIYQPALFAIIQDSLPTERRGIGSSITQLIHGAFNTPGPVIAGLLLLEFGLVTSMRIIYLLMTILFLIAAFWRLRLTETMSNREPIRLRYFVSSYPKAVRESLKVWKILPRSTLWLIIGQITAMFGMSLIQVISAVYARDILLIPEEQWWLTFIPLLLMMILGSVPIGMMIDRIGRKIPLIIGVLVTALGSWIFMNGDLLEVMGAMALLGLGQLALMAGSSALFADLVKQENRGKVNGFTNFAGYVAMGFGMLLGNYLYVSSFPQMPFYVTLGLAIPELLIIIFLIHEPKDKADSISLVSGTLKG
jgi:MFS transporter, DHA1 family, tetracycline resistance protein